MCYRTVDRADCTVPTGQHELLWIIQIKNLFALKDLDHGVGVDDPSDAYKD